VKTKVLALHLPQFHETEENNKWWGQGFTEWTNVKKALPLFKGHNQPRVPYNNNYYDLSEVKHLKDQCEMAKEFGLSGFCYYHYWFDGYTLLHKPLQILLENPDINFPFCFSWANDPWNRSWDGSEKEILVDQFYGTKKNWLNHLQYLLPFFKDSRYIKINGKPVFFIYRAMAFDQMDEMMEVWDQILQDEGFAGIYWIETLNSFQQRPYFQSSSGVFTFEPMLTLRKRISLVNRIKGKLGQLFNFHPFYKDEYTRVWKELLNLDEWYEFHPKERISGAFVDWDNTPRKQKKGLVIQGADPNNFKNYFRTLYQRAVDRKDPFLVINAWNEWAEGCYLEPDEKFKFGYLNALKEVIIQKEQNG